LSKKYKTKGGLKRNTAAKHNQSQGKEQQRPFTPSTLVDIVNSALAKVKSTKVCSSTLRNEWSSYTFEQLEGESGEFTTIRSIYEGIVKNGDAEKFYEKFYATTL